MQHSFHCLEAATAFCILYVSMCDLYIKAVYSSVYYTSHRLLHIPRESVPVDTFKRQYQWNQIPPQYLIHPEQRGTVGDAFFLPLHPGIVLTGAQSPCSLPPATHKVAEHIAELHRLANE